MRVRVLAALTGGLVAGAMLLALPSASAQTGQKPVVRIAELEIDPAQIDSYKAALRAEITASIQDEPGVLNLYAVSIKDHPAQIRLFEVYASPAAYQAHLQSAHFRKYKRETAGMVKSLTLLETDPILLGAK